MAVVAAMGGGQGLPPPGAASVVAAVAAWSLTWIGLMIQEATFGIGDLVGMGFSVQAATVGVVVIGTIVVAATARAGNACGGYEVATAQARRAVWAPSRCPAPAPSRG